VTASAQHEFTVALETLVEQVRDDRTILAAILCGSLSHDMVWAKSDIDLVLVTTDDRKADPPHVALYANGMNVHAMLMPRAEFRATVEGELRNSFVHSFLTKGRLLYTHDETITALCASLHQIGERDTQVQLLRAGSFALHPLYKARKWFHTRGDLDYTALWILYAATALAQIEVLSAGLLVDREVIPRALTLNPDFFRVVYTDLLNTPKTREGVQRALDASDAYLAARAERLFGPILQHLQDVGETRSATEIDNHFARNLGVDGVTTACEYLADEGLIGKASTPVRLTRKSNVAMQELAFFALGSARRDEAGDLPPAARR
jgi:hypothetical protein